MKMQTIFIYTRCEGTACSGSCSFLVGGADLVGCLNMEGTTPFDGPDTEGTDTDSSQRKVQGCFLRIRHTQKLSGFPLPLYPRPGTPRLHRCQMSLSLDLACARRVGSTVTSILCLGAYLIRVPMACPLVRGIKSNRTAGACIGLT